MPKYTIQFKPLSSKKINVVIWNNETGEEHLNLTKQLRDETEIKPFVTKYQKELTKLNK